MDDFQSRAATRFAAWQDRVLAREATEPISSGPLQCFPVVVSDVPEGEAAIGTDGSRCPTSAEIDAIVSRVRARHLRPVFEFILDANPDLPARLEERGFAVDERNPMMALETPMFMPVTTPNVDVRRLTPESSSVELREFQRIRWTDGGELPGAAVPPLDGLRRQLQSAESLYALARLDGIAGTGILHRTGPVGELVGIVTDVSRRRRGVAAAVTSFLLETHFAMGGDFAFLDAANVEAARVYARLGFREFGTLLIYK